MLRSNSCLLRFGLVLLGCTLAFSPQASGQVFDSGPSDPALFTTVLNLPPDPNIGNSGEVGNGTQLNVTDGGTVGFGFDANSGSEVNISGGNVGRDFVALSGSEVNISGGTVEFGFIARSGSEVNISGGNVGINPPIFFTGGGFIAESDSEVNITGGIVSARLEAVGSEVNITGGSMRSFEANSGSQVNITGGSVGSSSEANSGSLVNICGGSVGAGFDANSGSEVNITGGTVGSGFDALPGSVVELFGGEFRLNGDAFSGTSITLAEDDVFTGTLADGSSFIFSSSSDRDDSLSGVTLSPAPLPVLDTTPVVIDSSVTEGPVGLRVGQTLTLVEGGSLPNNFAVVDAMLDVQGGTLGFGGETTDSVVNITGGNVGSGFYANSGSEVTISGGSVGSSFIANFGSEVNINGGTVGRLFHALRGSEVSITGGILTEVRAFGGSEVNITGGTFGTAAFGPTNGLIGFGGVVNISGGLIQDGIIFEGEANISGGTFGPFFDGFDRADVNFFGTQFLLNGQLLDGLVAGELFTITEPFETLSGVLADGSSFNFSGLNSNGESIFGRFTTVTLTIGPPGLLGDFDGDEDVDLDDLDRYHQNIGAAATGALADLDLDGDGIVGANDFQTLYQELVMTSNGQVGTVQGDANLDGVVDVLGDGFIFFANLGNSVTSWSRADFNGDGAVTVLGDGFSLIANLGFTNDL